MDPGRGPRVCHVCATKSSLSHHFAMTLTPPSVAPQSPQPDQGVIPTQSQPNPRKQGGRQVPSGGRHGWGEAHPVPPWGANDHTPGEAITSLIPTYLTLDKGCRVPAVPFADVFPELPPAAVASPLSRGGRGAFRAPGRGPARPPLASAPALRRSLPPHARPRTGSQSGKVALHQRSLPETSLAAGQTAQSMLLHGPGRSEMIARRPCLADSNRSASQSRHTAHFSSGLPAACPPPRRACARRGRTVPCTAPPPPDIQQHTYQSNHSRNPDRSRPPRRGRVRPMGDASPGRAVRSLPDQSPVATRLTTTLTSHAPRGSSHSPTPSVPLPTQPPPTPNLMKHVQRRSDVIVTFSTYRRRDAIASPDHKNRNMPRFGSNSIGETTRKSKATPPRKSVFLAAEKSSSFRHRPNRRRSLRALTFPARPGWTFQKRGM